MWSILVPVRLPRPDRAHRASPTVAVRATDGGGVQPPAYSAAAGTAAPAGLADGDDPADRSDPAGTIDLSDLPRGVLADVVRLRFAGHAAADERLLAMRLAEIGFVPGEQVLVTAAGMPGHEPIAVRIGGHGGRSTFGLRRREAQLVRVLPAAVAHRTPVAAAPDAGSGRTSTVQDIPVVGAPAAGAQRTSHGQATPHTAPAPAPERGAHE